MCNLIAKKRLENNMVIMQTATEILWLHAAQRMLVTYPLEIDSPPPGILEAFPKSVCFLSFVLSVVSMFFTLLIVGSIL